MSDAGGDSAYPSDSSPNSSSLVSRHVHHLQQSVTALQNTQAFVSDRLANLETISASQNSDLERLQPLPNLLQELLERVSHLEAVEREQAAALEVQRICIARLSRRIQGLEVQARR